MNRFAAYAAIAALSGCASVAIGAFAAHGVSDARAHDLIETGAHYQFMHSMASLASLTMWNWGAGRARFAPPIFLLGMLLFCGSLYALAGGAPRSVGAITPVGGLLFLAGWLTLAFAALQLKPRDNQGRTP